jgi:hypothetical protein
MLGCDTPGGAAPSLPGGCFTSRLNAVLKVLADVALEAQQVSIDTKFDWTLG